MDVPTVQQGWNDLCFPANLDTKQQEAMFCEHNGRKKTWNLKRIHRSLWQGKCTINMLKVSNLPLQSPGEVLGVLHDDLDSRNIFCPVLMLVWVSLPPLSPANRDSAQSLVLLEAWWSQFRLPGLHSLLSSPSFRGLGWDGRSWCEMLCEPSSVRVATPKHTCSVTFHPQQICCGVDDGGLCLRNALWLESSV